MANSASVAADAVEEASTSGKDASSCHFHPVPPSKSAFQNGMVTSNLTKWGLLPNLKVHRYRYDRSYHKTAADQMLLDMFNDPGFRQDFRVMRHASASPGGFHRSSCLPVLKTCTSHRERIDIGSAPVRAARTKIACRAQRLRPGLAGATMKWRVLSIANQGSSSAIADMRLTACVHRSPQVMRKGGQWGPLEGPVHRVINESVPATVVSMSFFDRLEETDPPIVHPSTASES